MAILLRVLSSLASTSTIPLKSPKEIIATFTNQLLRISLHRQLMIALSLNKNAFLLVHDTVSTACYFTTHVPAAAVYLLSRETRYQLYLRIGMEIEKYAFVLPEE